MTLILTVFLEGLISFFSPCVLPLLPVYIGYLSGGTLKRDEDKKLHYDKKRVMINTFFFTVGVSFAFLLLGLGVSAMGRFFSGHQMIFAGVGGIIVMLFGLYQLGVLGESRVLGRQIGLPLRMEKMTMSPIVALLFGFMLSFAWSPCIGPILSSVLIMAAAASTASAGFWLIGVYTLGYIIPFLLVGLFTTSLMEFFGKHRNVVQYTVKIGGILLIIMGLLMFTGKMNGISSYLSSIGGKTQQAKTEDAEAGDAEAGDAETGDAEAEDAGAEDAEAEDAGAKDAGAKDAEAEDAETEAGETRDAQTDTLPAVDFTLTDQNGMSHTLSDYNGKIVFLNFWATWCPPCREELPYIQELYEEYKLQPDPDVVFLTVSFPGMGSETDVEGVKGFLDENGYTFPVLMDTEALLLQPYYISAFPTTYLIDPDGNVLGYIPGGMTKDMMMHVIDEARSASKGD